jgi:hypothetical protein
MQSLKIGGPGGELVAVPPLANPGLIRTASPAADDCIGDPTLLNAYTPVCALSRPEFTAAVKAS